MTFVILQVCSSFYYCCIYDDRKPLFLSLDTVTCLLREKRDLSVFGDRRLREVAFVRVTPTLAIQLFVVLVASIVVILQQSYNRSDQNLVHSQSGKGCWGGAGGGGRGSYG